MRQIGFVGMLILIPFVGAMTVGAEDTVAPADNFVGQAVGDAQAALENLDFASGEITAYDPISGKLDVKVYLDAAGDAKERVISLSVDQETEITNGESDLKPDALKPSAEIDVEYDTTKNKATYIFIY